MVGVIPRTLSAVTHVQPIESVRTWPSALWIPSPRHSPWCRLRRARKASGVYRGLAVELGRDRAPEPSESVESEL